MQPPCNSGPTFILGVKLESDTTYMHINEEACLAKFSSGASVQLSADFRIYGKLSIQASVQLRADFYESDETQL